MEINKAMSSRISKHQFLHFLQHIMADFDVDGDKLNVVVEHILTNEQYSELADYTLDHEPLHMS